MLCKKEEIPCAVFFLQSPYNLLTISLQFPSIFPSFPSLCCPLLAIFAPFPSARAATLLTRRCQARGGPMFALAVEIERFKDTFPYDIIDHPYYIIVLIIVLIMSNCPHFTLSTAGNRCQVQIFQAFWL